MNKENAHTCFKQIGVDMVLDSGCKLYYTFSSSFMKQAGMPEKLGREVEDIFREKGGWSKVHKVKPSDVLSKFYKETDH